MLVPLIMLVAIPVLVAGGVAILVPLIMLALVRCIVRILVPLIMLALARCIVAILEPLIMLALAPWPHTAEVSGDGLPRGPAATAVEAPRAITPAAKAPIIKGRLKVITFRRRAT